MTISQYKNHIKVQKAIDLFKIENMNITEVAQRVGFENQFYFSRVLKNITGNSLPSTSKIFMCRTRTTLSTRPSASDSFRRGFPPLVFKKKRGAIRL